MDVAWVTTAFNRDSGWAKSPFEKPALYHNDFNKVARVNITWSDGGTESIRFTYLDHGQCRDVYSGSSARAGPLVFKLQLAKYDSTDSRHSRVLSRTSVPHSGLA